MVPGGHNGQPGGEHGLLPPHQGGELPHHCPWGAGSSGEGSLHGAPPPHPAEVWTGGVVQMVFEAGASKEEGNYNYIQKHLNVYFISLTALFDSI